MSDKPKYNYQTTGEIEYHIGTTKNIHLCINGIGDTAQEAKDLFDHAFNKFSGILRDAGVKIDDS